MNLLSLPIPRPKAPPAQLPLPAMTAVQTPQARPSWWNQAAANGNPYNYIPNNQDLLLYEQLVSMIPLLNAALMITTELIGTARFEHPDDVVEAELGEWLERVRVSRVQQGFINWQNTWVLDHLMYGRSHAEILPSADNRDIAAIQELHPRTIAYRSTPDVYDVEIVQWLTGMGTQTTLNPATIATATYDVRTDNPYGQSLFWGLPFIAEILAAMFSNLGETWKRYGTPTFSVKWKPYVPEQFNDPSGEVGTGIVTSMLATLRDVQLRRMKGDIADFAWAGDYEISVLGAQGEQLDFTLPARTVMEQLVAKLHLPPMLFGLQWQAGERIGAEQAKLLSASIDAKRAGLAPGLLYVVQMRQALAGKPTDVTLCWDAPTLQDAIATAQADLYEAQAEEKDLANDKDLWRLGVIGAEEFARRHRADLEGLSNEEVVAALAAEGLTMPTEPPAAPVPMPFGGGGGGLPPPPARSLTYGNGNGRH